MLSGVQAAIGLSESGYNLEWMGIASVERNVEVNWIFGLEVGGASPLHPDSPKFQLLMSRALEGAAGGRRKRSQRGLWAEIWSPIFFFTPSGADAVNWEHWTERGGEHSVPNFHATAALASEQHPGSSCEQAERESSSPPSAEQYTEYVCVCATHRGWSLLVQVAHGWYSHPLTWVKSRENEILRNFWPFLGR